jgi:predicted kinase
MSKVMIIVRGVSGTGKTTYAKAAADGMASDTVYSRSAHIEADQFFTDQDGAYHFASEWLGDAHRWAQLEVKKNMIHWNDIVVSNTFTTFKEIKPYLELANEFKYTVYVVTLTKEFGSVHNVPEEVMERQRARLVPHEEILEKVKEFMVYDDA